MPKLWPGIFGKKTVPANVAVMDFGTSSVKTAIADFSTFNPTLLGLAEESYKEGTILSGLVADLEDFLDTCVSSLRKASLACGFTPHDFVFSLSGEFVKSFTVNLKISRPSGGKVSPKERSAIEAEIKRLVLTEVAGEFSKITGSPNPEFKVTERRVLKMTNLEGGVLEGFDSIYEKDFKLTLDVSFVSLQTERLLGHTISRLKKNVLYSVDQMVSLVDLLRRDWGNFSAVLVDFGGQVTDVYLVVLGNIVGARTVPLGGKDLTAEVGQELGLSAPIVEEKKISGDLTFEYRLPYLQFWLRSLERAVTEISGGSKLPRLPFYLTGRGAKFLPPQANLEEFLKLNPSSLWRDLEWKTLGPAILKGKVLVKEDRVDDFLPLLASLSGVLVKYAADEF